jgi:tripartite-type tricarboxylate transporter receptor subunit TctC
LCGLIWIVCAEGTSISTVSKLNAAIVEALASANVRARFAELRLDVFPPEQRTAMAALQKAEIDKWWPIISAVGIKVIPKGHPGPKRLWR